MTKQQPNVLRLAAIYAALGLFMTALGVLRLINLIRGDLGLAIFSLFAAVLCFGIAGYVVWGYFWSKKHPEVQEKGRQEAHLRKHLLKGPDG